MSEETECRKKSKQAEWHEIEERIWKLEAEKAYLKGYQDGLMHAVLLDAEQNGEDA